MFCDGYKTNLLLSAEHKYDMLYVYVYAVVLFVVVNDWNK